MEKNWKRLTIKEFAKEIQNLSLRELKKLEKKIRFWESEAENEDLGQIMSKRFILKSRIWKLEKKKENRSESRGLEWKRTGNE